MTAQYHTYEVDLARRPFGHSSEELKVLCTQSIELLRCAADGGDAYDDFGRTIEAVALELDSSLFVTLLARMWAQNVMALQGEPFENVKVVLLEAALQLEKEP
jgi:hypothetical protein